MEIGLLGPLTVVRGTEVVSLGGPRQRTVLAQLLLRAGHEVSQAQLIDLVWGEDPPPTARGSLQAYVSRLRAALGADRIQGHDGRYVLHVDPSELDLRRFESLCDEARRLAVSDPAASAQALRAALALWRGPALEDLADQPSLAAAIVRLDDLRLAATEEWVTAELALGRHDAMVPALEELVESHPFRERFWGQLMVALYRSGRQQEALQTYRRVAGLLGEELGIDPWPELQRLHEQVIRQDPALDLVERPLRGYRLVEQVGAGTFGTVHRALQPEMGREVAVKVIRPELANDPDFIRGFDAEAQIAARLEHPHIVPLHDYWREPDGAYLVMRYLRGGSLRTRLHGHGLPVDRVVRLVDQIAHALDHAHRQGIVHRDVKPPNILFDEDGNAYLSDFGIARDVAAANGEAELLPDRVLEYLSPEAARGEPVDRRADVYSLGLVAFESLTGRHPWLDGSAAEPRALPSVRTWCPDLPQEVDRVLARATAAEPADRPEDVLAVADDLGRALVPIAGVASRSDAGSGTRNPYKGLRPFTAVDAADFHGRAALVTALLQALAGDGPASRFVAVVGPSGSGKSSVVGGGLVPALRAGAVPGSEEWFVAQMLPGGRPFESLALALEAVAAVVRPDLAEELRHGSGLTGVAASLLPDPSARLLLVVDQFEEVFTLVDAKERDRFLEVLADAAGAPEGQVRVVVTLRADFYDQPLGHRGIAELVSAGTVTVTPLTPAELERAIAAPAESVGVQVEPALVAALVADVADQAAPLPALQYALTEMFDRRDGDRLTFASYDAVGGVTAALARTADDLFDSLSLPAQVAARQLFLRLVTLSDEVGAVTRRRVARSELTSLDSDAGAMDEAIDAFGARRLLTFDRDPLTRGPTVEVAHEALLWEWGRLRGWIEAHRTDVLTHERLSAATAEWVEAGRDDSVLLRGERLRRFESWAETSVVGLSADEREFLAAGVARRTARLRREEEQQARERTLERRSLVRLRAAVVVVGLFALLASVLTVVALGQREEAREQARVSQARELAAAALANLEQDPELSVLLALESVGATAQDQAGVLRESEEALHRSLQTLRVVRQVPQGGGGLAVTGDGARIVTAGSGEDPTPPTVWDADTGEALGELAAPPGARVLALGPDDRLVVTAAAGARAGMPAGSGDGTVDLWSLVTGEHVATLRSDLGYVASAAFSPDGRFVAAGGGAGDVHVWTVADGRRVLELPGEGLPMFAVAFSPDGSRIVTGGEDPVVRLWETRSGRLLSTMRGHEWPVVAVAFSPDGRRIVSGAFDAQARVWSANTGELVRIITGGTPVQSLAFSPDGQTLVTGGTDAVATVWDLATGRELVRLVGHRGGPLGNVAFLPDGDHVVTSGLDGTTRIWDVSPAGARDWLTVASVEQIFSGVTFGADGSFFAAPARPSGVGVWDTSTGESLTRLRGHRPKLTTVALSPDGDLVAGGSDVTSSPPVWDLGTGELLHRLEGHEGFVRAITFSPDGKRILTTSFDGLRVWDARTGVQIEGPLELAGDPFVLLFSPDGEVLAVGEGRSLVLRDAATLAPQRTLAGHTGVVMGAAFAPGDTIITTADDGTARVWDAETGEERLVFRGHRGPVNQADVSPDGATVATTGEDGTTRLWDLRTGEETLTLVGHASLVYGVDFSPDGRLLATASPDGTVALHLLPVDELVDLARERVTRDLTDDECRQYLHVARCP